MFAGEKPFTAGATEEAKDTYLLCGCSSTKALLTAFGVCLQVMGGL
jgi:hypothetical protein